MKFPSLYTWFKARHYTRTSETDFEIVNRDIWTRLTTWKFPLLQLVASFPRPPLSFWVEFFVILHLLGDPINTMKNLLVKMLKCQEIAEYWRNECEMLLEKPPGEDEDRDWKALALLTDAYGEWSKDDEAKLALQRGLWVIRVIK